MTEIAITLPVAQPDPVGFAAGSIAIEPGNGGPLFDLATPVQDAPGILPDQPEIPQADLLAMVMEAWSGISGAFASPVLSAAAPPAPDALASDPPDAPHGDAAVPMLPAVPMADGTAPLAPQMPAPLPVPEAQAAPGPPTETGPLPAAIASLRDSQTTMPQSTAPQTNVAEPPVPGTAAAPDAAPAHRPAAQSADDPGQTATRQLAAPVAETPPDPAAVGESATEPLRLVPDTSADTATRPTPRAEAADAPLSGRSPMPDPRPVARQIAEAVVTTREAETEIALAPEELGRLRLVMAGPERGQITIFAERPETLDLIRRNADLLVQTLADAGIAHDRLDFREDRDRPVPPPPRGEDGGRPVTGETTLHVALTAPRALSDRRLDIRI